jgi:peptide chain release factor 1
VPPRAATTPSSSWSSSSASTGSARRSAVFDLALTYEGEGILVFRVQGPGAAEAFRDEAGGHRWQRIPPGDKRGRVQTSTITVAVLPEPSATELRLAPGDLDWVTCRGSGPGGQHRNKTESCVVVTHKPTGLSVRCESERSQHQNREAALALLRARLHQAEVERRSAARADDRRRQVGSGMRGDKRRTIRCQEGVVVDHPTGRTWALRSYEKGEW